MSTDYSKAHPVLGKGDVITHYTTVEGGLWYAMEKPSHYFNKIPKPCHSFKTRVGRRWDEINGWTE